ncbi:MAG: phosphate/phosphite/phosphonate ABC transporter substrate-binding protein [Desulfuromonadales bacterium]|nr:phosphate/phosphite/phosphonate ABC transporter substrate-binding protein [Desulfuromonadales bacterium]
MSLLRYLLIAGLLVVISLPLSGCEQAGERQKMKIGYMNCNSEAETRARFLPLTAYLSHYTGIDFEAVPVDTHEFAERYAQGEFALTHSNSLLYVQLKFDHELQLLAAEKRGNFGSRSAGTIIARKGSGIEKLTDLKGKRMVFGPMMAPTGYLAQYDLMLRSGIDPERDLAYYAIPSGSFKHEKLVYGVYFGAFDVAAAPLLDLEVMTREGKITADDFVILGQSPLVPYCTFGAAAKLDPAVVEKVRRALLELTPETTVDIAGERVKVLKSAWIDGFEALRDADYDVVRDMARRVNMPPYQEY